MDPIEQIAALDNELDKVVERFRKEYDLPYASIIGCLYLKAHELADEGIDSAREDEP